MCRLMTFNCGKDQQLNKSYSRGRTTEIPGHRTMGHAVLFIFRMGQELTQISNTENRGLAPQEHRSKEQSEKKEKKTLLVSMTSAQEKRNKAEGKLHYIIFLCKNTDYVILILRHHTLLLDVVIMAELCS